MNVLWMRRLDRWVGVPVCALLTWVRRTLDVLGAGAGGPLRRILFVKLAEQGSTVLAYPTLCEAVRRVGAENVFFLTFQENRFILDVMEVIPPENVVAIPTHSVWALVAGTLRAVGRLRALRMDAAVDLEFFARSSAILTWLSGATSRAGYHAYFGEARYRGDLMTHRVSFNPHVHASQTFAMLVHALDEPPERLPAFDFKPPSLASQLPSFRPRPEEVQEVRRLVCELTGLAEAGPLILLNANCSDLLPLRRWETERYVELARRLLQRYDDVFIAFTGGPGEAPAVEGLVARIDSPRCISLAGRTTLRQLLVLYGLAELMITNDSGPAHFATLTPMDVITLFGPETPRLFASQSPRSHVLWAGLACSPCVSAYNDRQSACRDNICMKHISVEAVFAKACEVYEARRGGEASKEPRGFSPRGPADAVNAVRP